MSYLQPLITSAFATYAMSRSAYADQATGTQGVSKEEANNRQQVNGVGQGHSVGTVSGNERVGGVDRAGKTESTFDPDAGKPQSSFGDVLDLSNESQQTSKTAQATDTEKVDDSNSLDAAKGRLNDEAKTEADGKLDQARENRKADTAASDQIELQEPESEEAAVASATGQGASELTPEEEQQVQELQARDTEVRLHEQQHVSAGGAYVTGGPSYTYQTGPDGKQYAIGGEVSIDVSEVAGDPEATVRKMQTVQAAALAPAEPSSQDYKVAAAARQAQSKAQMELSRQQAEQMNPAADSTEEGDSELPSLSKTDQADSAQTGMKSTDSSADKVAEASSSASVGAAYQAQSKMVSGQTGGARFSAFA